MASSDRPDLPQPTLPEGGADPVGAAGMLGRTLDRYRLERVLGEGGMGVVYLGVHEALEREVAVKVLRPEVSRDAKTVARFKREAKAASAIGSPHICDVSDFGALEDGSTYFVMELLRGPSLGAILKAREPLQTQRLLKIASQLCDALGAAHAAGIVHRDLKPDNVHLVPKGDDPEFVKVLDFGIAKVQNAAETKLTQAGQVFGTPHYMSPEQCAGHDVDQRTDIYALGVIIYEMACGRVPFDADNLMGLLTKHVYEQPIAPRELPPPVDVPPGLEAVILKCLAKQPASRYQQMSELEADLEALRAGRTPSAVVSELDRSLPAVPATAYRGPDREGPSRGPSSVVPGAVPEAPAPQRTWVYAAAAALALIGGVTATLAASGVFSAAPPAPPPIADAAEDRPPGRNGLGAGAPALDTSDAPTDGVPWEQGASHEGRLAEGSSQGSSSQEGSAEPAPRTQIATAPEGAEVFGPDGSLVGNTPVRVARPGDGEPPVEYRIRLAGHEERTFAVGPATAPEVTLTLEASSRPARRGRRRRGPRPPPRDPAPADPTLPQGTPDDASEAVPEVSPGEGDLRNPFGPGGEATR